MIALGGTIGIILLFALGMGIYHFTAQDRKEKPGEEDEAKASGAEHAMRMKPPSHAADYAQCSGNCHVMLYLDDIVSVLCTHRLYK